MTKDIVFNHDGFGLLSFLAATDMTERDAADLLVRPLAEIGITAIDWSILSTAHHNCRTRYNFAYEGPGPGRPIDAFIAKVISHYNRQPLDLLDIVVKHGHEQGLQVFGNVRLNHSSLEPELLLKVPGRNFVAGAVKKDFRDEAFHGYLCNLFEDILEKGVDGIVLDFERKTPFFPEEATAEERLQAGASFMRRIRKLTDKPVVVRCAYQAEKGTPEGQDPISWIAEGLVDAVIPATHNHEADDFAWGIERFTEAAEQSSRPCRVWPQIWPTGVKWAAEGTGQKTRHSAKAVRERCRSLIEQGADGVYFFNYCCDGWPSPPDFENAPDKYADYAEIFQDMPGDKARSEAIFSGLKAELNRQVAPVMER